MAPLSTSSSGRTSWNSRCSSSVIVTPTSSRSTPDAPRPRRERVELERRAVRGVEPPPNPARRDPVLDASEVVIVEPEPPPHGLLVGEVEHLRGGQPLVDEVEQPPDDAEHRVRLPERAVGEPDAQVGRPHVRRQRLQLIVVLEDLARAERRLDERRERLDVRAHDDHVARLERRVLVEQMQDRVSAGPRPAERGRGRRGPARCGRLASSTGRSSVWPGSGGTGGPPVGPHVRLEVREQACRLRARRRGDDRRSRSPRAPTASPASPAPKKRAAGSPAAPRSDRPAAGRPHARSATRSHSAGDGCSMKTCTSRPTASARSTLRCPAGSRVSPKSDSRAGRSTIPGSSRNRAHAPSTRSAGSGTPIRARSRRQAPPARPRRPAPPHPPPEPKPEPSPADAARTDRTAPRDAEPH